MFEGLKRLTTGQLRKLILFAQDGRDYHAKRGESEIADFWADVLFLLGQEKRQRDEEFRNVMLNDLFYDPDGDGDNMEDIAKWTNVEDL